MWSSRQALSLITASIRQLNRWRFIQGSTFHLSLPQTYTLVRRAHKPTIANALQSFIRYSQGALLVRIGAGSSTFGSLHLPLEIMSSPRLSAGLRIRKIAPKYFWRCKSNRHPTTAPLSKIFRYWEPIPADTSVPHWAYLNVSVCMNDNLNRFQPVTDRWI